MSKVIYTGGGTQDAVNTVPPKISLFNSSAQINSVRVGNKVKVSNGTWTGSGPLTFTYQWKLNGGPVLAETYYFFMPDNIMIGDILTCDVTATAPSGSVTVSSNMCTILNGKPIAKTRPACSSKITAVGDSAVLSTALWFGDGLTFEYGFSPAWNNSTLVYGPSNTKVIGAADIVPGASGGYPQVFAAVRATNSFGSTISNCIRLGSKYYMSGAASVSILGLPQPGTQILLTSPAWLAQPATPVTPPDGRKRVGIRPGLQVFYDFQYGYSLPGSPYVYTITSADKGKGMDCFAGVTLGATSSGSQVSTNGTIQLFDHIYIP